MNSERENAFLKDQQNIENKHHKSSDSVNSSLNSDRQKSVNNKQGNDAKSKNRKIVHDFLYFIEAINNREFSSQFRSREAENQTERVAGEGVAQRADSACSGCRADDCSAGFNCAGVGPNEHERYDDAQPERCVLPTVLEQFGQKCAVQGGFGQP